MRTNSIFELQPPTIDDVKVEAQVIQDKNSIVISLVLPNEILGELDNKKGNLLRDTFIEVKKIANDLNTALETDNKRFLDKFLRKS